MNNNFEEDLLEEKNNLGVNNLEEDNLEENYLNEQEERNDSETNDGKEKGFDDLMNHLYEDDKPKKKSNFKSFIAIALVASVISSKLLEEYCIQGFPVNLRIRVYCRKILFSLEPQIN